MTEEKYTRPATIADLKAVIQSLNKNGVDYFLIGGYALFAHGYYRATTDIDILVPTTREQGEKVIGALQVLPGKVAGQIDPAWFEEGETIRVADEFVVDLMFSASGETSDTLARYAEIINLDGTPVRTLSLEGLLLTKQTVRERDVMDRMVLQGAIDAAA
ncbi:MAG: hypothetical protein FD134_2402 [Gallionellaceae bacterium]|jgi:hypothetical protein|nr:MAG: hypothetical protein FD134_2402 [Gallionellaceae bacterium]